MLPDTFLPNFVLFLLGQAAACIYLRTGRYVLGGSAMALLWVSGDWAIVARTVYGETGPWFTVALHGMQATAAAALGALAFGGWRRRWSAAARRRPERFAAGLTQYLRGDLAGAVVTFRGIVRTDPWDAAGWVALGNAMRGDGRAAAARRCYRRARWVDRSREYRDFVGLQMQRLQGKPRVRRTVQPRLTTAGSPSPLPHSHPARS